MFPIELRPRIGFHLRHRADAVQGGGQRNHGHRALLRECNVSVIFVFRLQLCLNAIRCPTYMEYMYKYAVKVAARLIPCVVPNIVFLSAFLEKHLFTVKSIKCLND